MVNLSKNPAARQPLPQIPVPPPMMMGPQDHLMALHSHHQVSMGQQVGDFCLIAVLLCLVTKDYTQLHTLVKALLMPA